MKNSQVLYSFVSFFLFFFSEDFNSIDTSVILSFGLGDSEEIYFQFSLVLIGYILLNLVCVMFMKYLLCVV